MTTLIGCDLNDSTILSTQETTEEKFANGPTSDEQMITEELIELTPTKTILTETEGPEVQLEGDINLSDIPMGSPTNLEIESIDLNEWNIQADGISSIEETPDGSKIVMFSNYSSEEAQIVIIEESEKGVWSLYFSGIFPGVNWVKMSPSGKMLALVFGAEEYVENGRLAIFDLDSKMIMAEVEVLSPYPIVSWSEDEQRVISFLFYRSTMFSPVEVVEIYSVPSLKLIDTITRNTVELEGVSRWGFWWSPDQENNKFIMKTAENLYFWEGENYEVIDTEITYFLNLPMGLSWINGNKYLVMAPMIDFYLYNGPELVDKYIISQEEGTYHRFADTVVNPETLKIGALLTDIRMVLLEIRDDEIRSLCQVDIKSIADIGPVELYGFISLDSVFYLSEDNLLHIISNITCD
jgi:hypothetical protein